MTPLTDTEAGADGAAPQAELTWLSATVPPLQVHLSVRPTDVGPDDVTALAKAVTT